MEVKVFKDKQEVAEKFSEYLAQLISSRDVIYVALSGGSTPKVVFDHLAEHFQDLDWSRVHFFWGDERCVPPEDQESNYKMTVDHLLSRINMPVENIHRIKGENEPVAEAASYSEQLVRFLPSQNGIPQFDLVILGMGSDGHTASIFPDQLHLWTSGKLCEVAEHLDTGQKRLTITGKVINNAMEVAFLVTGADKREKVNEVLRYDRNSQQYPAALVSPQSKKLLWFTDETAAGSR